MQRQCQYQNIFGTPEKGVHSYRIFNIAIVDVILTLLLAMIITYFTKYSYKNILLFLLLTGIFLHWFFCVNTTVNRFLGLV